MAVIIVQSVKLDIFHIFCKLTAHQRLYVLWKQAYCTCRKCSMLYRPPWGVDDPDFRSHPLT